MSDVISLVELVVYIVAILAISMAVTWLVVKVSPSEAQKELRARGEQKSS
jgi:uncharacterized membrane protein (DUF485 family)